MIRKNRLITVLCVALCGVVAANDDKDIVNYVAYSDVFASSGQPSAQQLTALRRSGTERIIYIAYSDHERSLANEDRVAKQLGMQYIHIPVEWDAPTASDFELFASVMNAAPQTPTLLHCQMNYRATAFALLYRVSHAGLPLADAKADMNAVWTPNETWTEFLLATLTQAGIDPACEGCDWTPSKPQH